jgi:hypothetical protein
MESYLKEFIYKYKEFNNEIPPEFIHYIDTSTSKQRNNKKKKITTKQSHGWNRVEGRGKNNWLIQTKLSQNTFDKLLTQIRMLLNKLSNKNTSEIIHNILQIIKENYEIIEIDKIIDLIIMKSLIEINYILLYIKLLNQIIIIDQQYKTIFINKCSEIFVKITNEISNKNIIISITTFIGELYNINIITNNEISFYYNILIKCINNKMIYSIDGICVLVSITRQKLNNENENELSKYTSLLQNIKNNSSQYGINIRDKFTIQDMFENF